MPKNHRQAFGLFELDSTMNNRQQPPILDDEAKQSGFGHLPRSPIEFPFTAEEIENFPRHLHPMTTQIFKHDQKLRRRYYRDQLGQIARNAKRIGRGANAFILVPDTTEKLLQEIKRGPGRQPAETERVLRQMYFLGKTPAEAGCQVSSKTLLRHLKRAEKIVDVLGPWRDNPFGVSLATIKISYVALRYGRDGNIDIRRYFRGKIF